MKCSLIVIIDENKTSILKNTNDQFTVITGLRYLLNSFVTIRKRDLPLSADSIFGYINKKTKFCFREKYVEPGPFSFRNLIEHKTNVSMVYIVDLKERNINIYKSYKYNTVDLLMRGRINEKCPTTCNYSRRIVFELIRRIYHSGFKINNQDFDMFEIKDLLRI
jgi:hypothetical protein